MYADLTLTFRSREAVSGNKTKQNIPNMSDKESESWKGEMYANLALTLRSREAR